MITGVFDKIPYNKEIIHIAHVFNSGKLIVKAFPKLLGNRLIAFFKPLKTKLVQIFPGSIAFRNVILWKFCHPKLNFHMTSFRNFMSIFQSFCSVGKQHLHLLRRFHIILTSLISHTIFICKLFPCLKAQQNIMRLGIFRQRIMHVVCHYQINSCFFVHFKELLIHSLLLRNSMILHFQKEIPLSKNILIPKRCRFCILVHSSCKILGYLACKTGAKRNNSLMVLFQNLKIHSRFIIKAFYKAFGNNLHKVTVALVIFCKKHQMIIAVLPTSCFSVKPGSRRHINLAAQNGVDSCCLRSPVKINHSIHNPMIRNSRTVHPQLFYTGHIFLDLIGAVQKTVFCMNMKMCKIHNLLLISLSDKSSGP